MVGLPAQVQQADERADELLKGDDGAQAAEHPEAGDKSTPANADLQKKYDDLVKAHEVLQGKYNTEIEALKDDVGLLQRLKNDLKTLKRELAERDELISDVTTQLDELKKKPAEPAPAAAPQALDLSTILSKEDQEYIQEEELGDKFLTIVSKVAAAVVQNQQGPDYSKRFDDMENRIKETDKKVETSQATQWENYVRSQIPNYDKYFGEGDKIDQEWIKWLNEPVSEYDPDTTNRHVLSKAMNAGNLAPVKKAIENFEARQATAASNTEKTDANSGLDSQLEPEETGAEAIDTTKGEAKVYDEAWVRQFYKDVALGKWRGREKEQAKIEKEIFEAGLKGNIR